MVEDESKKVIRLSGGLSSCMTLTTAADQAHLIMSDELPPTKKRKVQLPQEEISSQKYNEEAEKLINSSRTFCTFTF